MEAMKSSVVPVVVSRESETEKGDCDFAQRMILLRWEVGLRSNRESIREMRQTP
jgi:hypothetical protein